MAQQRREGYSDIFDAINKWASPHPGEYRRLRTSSGEFDRQFTLETRAAVLDIFPSVHQAIAQLREREQLVFSDNPLASYPNSPFAQLYTGSARLRKTLIEEAFARAEYFVDLPVEIADGLPQAWTEIRAIEKPQAPQLLDETVVNLSQIHDILDPLTFLRAVTGLTASHDLIQRTLAEKYQFTSSLSLGYNRNAVQFCEFTLVLLDTLAGCTPWQLKWDQAQYQARVNHTAFDFLNKQTSIARLTQPGRMWSRERLQEPEAREWMTALETGVIPSR
ncbi:hypothetical protein A2631_04485 [Candidatus Daviesbacteria bacterium RIFCSPHIGHO2_01_FULL_44_29]|uniref:Uncharacterized protein n=1 Tax=Candidatus Daviesbacteria bacterium RIFCSPHIGHO2_02_FULL_43_12 TaxID=1797776 RepID=A0A1F5KGN8_9BACT|nr:MAG: hypothetical protein A2631_04485 [Candidatus Daviesbacteria bacterium RIFCSPHIGHO2_01_FULL_44_29]OGE39629.1 MAG: hypothetical protein A3E86_03430 [Candidatus Daviesbacteria bacterium RIFCSPHIGHO2_12_FULL_47_45]OGE39980.1 MAG: hypothetical protein A3D25_04215 [Candidatus Daviesbacteria bacterium RIFCSPHIGHO2_02_FULL_43_12]OGE70339.1 MAG: hypothetical protein A3B55_01355 [Candidatus Daviesbacteria bacterium RIFCSPLOWO2_01_FULL_43_15]